MHSLDFYVSNRFVSRVSASLPWAFPNCKWVCALVLELVHSRVFALEGLEVPEWITRLITKPHPGGSPDKIDTFLFALIFHSVQFNQAFIYQNLI